jgi:O-antigen/teichoic acid export membrane protein
MVMSGTALPTASISATESGALGRRAFQLAGRYGLTAIGPIAVSGAHFVASLVFLHHLPPVDFGLFSFLLVVVPFCLSMSSGLLGAPLVKAIGKSKAVEEGQFAAFRKVNLVFCVGAGLMTATLIWASHAGLSAALALGCYGAVMSLRWFSRFNAYIDNHPRRAACSDLVYGSALLAGLFALVAANHLSLLSASLVLFGSSLLSVPVFGWTFLRKQFLPGFLGSFTVYAPIWHEVTRWSLLGVVLSEVTANAHAYFVTFLSGPKAFALLAIGSLLMRPVFLVLQALPDRERPTIARYLAAGDFRSAGRTRIEFRFAAVAAWLGTVTLAVAILHWYPQLFVRKGFDGAEVWAVVALWALIVAARALRAPEAVFLQAAGEFNALARTGVWASIVSVSMTLILLMWFGPIASLGGILCGELVNTVQIMALMRSWRMAHG